MRDQLGAVRLEEEYKEAAARLRTVRDLVRFGVSRFNEARLTYGHGTDNALDEAFYLVRHALHLPPAQAESFLDARLARSEVRAVLGLLQRRVRERLPAAYLTHEAWIGPHRFRVDARAIVPRSYIGHWLLGELSPWIEQPERVGQMLELCTGSGCLAVLAALALPRAHIDAVDVSAEALEVARENVGDYALDSRIELIQGDLFAALKRRRYDLIVANPPYVRSAVMSQLPPEYRHEPALALAGGEDGLDVVRRILAGAHAHLRPHGLLVMEVGHARPAVEAAYPRTAFTWIELD
ncbi:MAG: 50S ribosomal protein L3 N(5)-glutamine methyltransferase, partial [Burkholderiales bacterium]